MQSVRPTGGSGRYTLLADHFAAYISFLLMTSRFSTEIFRQKGRGGRFSPDRHPLPKPGHRPSSCSGPQTVISLGAGMAFRRAIRFREPVGCTRNRSRFARISGTSLPERNHLPAATTHGEQHDAPTPFSEQHDACAPAVGSKPSSRWIEIGERIPAYNEIAWQARRIPYPEAFRSSRWSSMTVNADFA